MSQPGQARPARRRPQRRLAAALTAMQDRGTLSRHFWLSRGMARATGADLTAARREGRLDEDAMADLIAHCVDCGQAARCTAWLGRHGAGTTAPPDWCAIAPALRGLSGLSGARGR